MPNWCWVGWKLTGTKKNIKDFCDHLVFEEDTDKDGLDKRYFARTFAEISRDEFMKQIEDKFKNKTFWFDCNCAWSATSCLIKGYPQDNKQAITLSDACKLHKVKAELNTEEPGMEFKEHIICEADGTISTDETFDYVEGEDE